MDTKTTIKSLMRGVSNISVPAYQRAYSWESRQLIQFINDLEDYLSANTSIPYYFGHFLFEEIKKDTDFNIIDGQQRLTTIIIFLSACFAVIQKKRSLTDTEKVLYEDTIKRGSCYKFSTVSYDKLFFNDYVINQTRKDRNNLDTNSKTRIADAYDYFCKYVSSKDVDRILTFVKAVSDSVCTTHIVTTESEAVQMFIFQNDRGKKPTKLEVIKAQFMYKIHVAVTDPDEKNILISEIQSRFERIYKASSKIDERIDEDDVLLYSLRVYFNTLSIDVSTDKIDQELKKADSVSFVQRFTNELELSFNSLEQFFSDRTNYEVYSLALLGGSLLLPFVIKAYKYNITDNEKNRLCHSLESILLRHRIISTRAHLEDRINDVYMNFKEATHDVQPIIDRINEIFMKTETEKWWSYWNTDYFSEAIQWKFDFNLVKHLLWRYENYLNSNTVGYSFILYDRIISPEVEHVAPQTPTDGTPVAAGYCDYDEEFINKYLDCIGNYLLISKSHNCKLGNEPFRDKLASYSALAQQREIGDFITNRNDPRWGKDQIKSRKEKITSFILETFSNSI